MITLERFRDLKGKEIQSTDGEKIGTVNELFVDENTRQPEWIGVGGATGQKKLVPVEGATVQGDCVCVPYSKQVVNDEPNFKEDDGRITQQSEDELYRYFGMTSPASATHRASRFNFDAF
jgi:sporulation protein YlmC with PRC-barrel domain